MVGDDIDRCSDTLLRGSNFGSIKQQFDNLYDGICRCGKHIPRTWLKFSSCSKWSITVEIINDWLLMRYYL